MGAGRPNEAGGHCRRSRQRTPSAPARQRRPSKRSGRLGGAEWEWSFPSFPGSTSLTQTGRGASKVPDYQVVVGRPGSARGPTERKGDGYPTGGRGHNLDAVEIEGTVARIR